MPTPAATRIRLLGAGLPPAAVLWTALATILTLGVAGCSPPELGTLNETPLKVLEERLGSGSLVRSGDVARIDYTMTYMDGRPLLADDDTYLTVGQGAVIEAVDATLIGMRVGGRRMVKVPPHRHWGRAGYGPIPPGTDLLLTIEVTEVRPPGWVPERETQRYADVLPRGID